jgi:biopolymer transport protein ExbD
MRRKRIKSSPKREGLILTSLVDIALSLVIGFIVALPFFFETGIFVSTPSVTKASGGEASDIKVNIHLKNDGRILLNEEVVSLEKLETLLPQLLARSLEKKVIVSAEKGIRYEKVVTILDLAKRAGAGQLCLLKTK